MEKEIIRFGDTEKKASFIAIKILFFQKNSDINYTLISINTLSGETKYNSFISNTDK